MLTVAFLSTPHSGGRPMFSLCCNTQHSASQSRQGSIGPPLWLHPCPSAWILLYEPTASPSLHSNTSQTPGCKQSRRTHHSISGGGKRCDRNYIFQEDKNLPSSCYYYFTFQYYGPQLGSLYGESYSRGLLLPTQLISAPPQAAVCLVAAAMASHMIHQPV